MCPWLAPGLDPGALKPAVLPVWSFMDQFLVATFPKGFHAGQAIRSVCV